MSLMPPKNCEEGAFQYCNYGYDRKKYSSREECMQGELLRCKDLKLTKPAIRPPMPTIPAEPKVEVADIKLEKDDKSDTNQLLLLGLGAIIIILLIKK